MDLCDIRDIKALLSRHGFHFSKSMGQNFLIEDWVPQDIAEAAGCGDDIGVLKSARASTFDCSACPAVWKGSLRGTGQSSAAGIGRDHERI